MRIVVISTAYIVRKISKYARVAIEQHVNLINTVLFLHQETDLYNIIAGNSALANIAQVHGKLQVLLSVMFEALSILS